MVKDYIIIGAGLSGLAAARNIINSQPGSVLVLDKSRGVGGRMATRRTLETRFDHGAQFYREKPDSAELHAFWKSQGVSHQWFVSEKGFHHCGKAGITALPKALAEEMDIALEKQIKTIRRENNVWKLISDKGEEWFCKNLIITSPLPQTINLMAEISSETYVDHEALLKLKQIHYTKALIGLVTLEEDVVIGEDGSGYAEFSSGDFFSLADQKKKGVSSIPALTVTMSPEFSETDFEKDESETLKKILESFQNFSPEAKIKGAELKKWRYCQPTANYDKKFLEIAPQLFLIGDVFGGNSLLGAIRSADALSEFLFLKKETIS